MTAIGDRVMVVISPKLEGAKETLNQERLAILAVFPGLGPIRSIDPIGGPLQQAADDNRRWLEEGRPDEPFQFLHRRAGGRLGGEPRHHRGDLCFLSEEAGRIFFFRESGNWFWRV